MRKSVFEAAKLAEDQAEAQWQGERVQVLMITPTYAASAASWEFEPRHMSEFLRRVRRFLGSKGIDRAPYVWVAERQRRGVLHYHLLLWIPARIWLPNPDRAGWWPHGSTRTERARRAVAYLGKYASKEEQKSGRFPKGCRMHGCGGLDLVHKQRRSWTMMPRYVRQVCMPEDAPQRCRGGYVIRATGEYVPTPWVVLDHAPDWGWVRFAKMGLQGEGLISGERARRLLESGVAA